ncbi:MAG: hypothetical protein MUC87_01390 [Bacteroidia bacterium]|nr:hypothetical protein [Bacteroidia bacterium]
MAFATQIEATQKGNEFRQLYDDERVLTDQINVLLDTYKQDPSDNNFDLLTQGIDQRSVLIKQKHDAAVVIVNHYESSGAQEQTAFFTAYLQHKNAQYGGGPHANHGDNDLTHAQIQQLFDSLRQKTDALQNPDDDQANLDTERSRFLVFVLQGMYDDIGVDQYRNLDRNLGQNRRVKIGRISKSNLSGGLANFQQIPQSVKTDDGGVGQDTNLLNQAHGSGLGYLRAKEQGYNRTANNQSNNITDVQVNMDKDDALIPIFQGVDNQDTNTLFTAPKKFTVHHEVGHINSMLEGKGGSGKRIGGDLSALTDQEELYNIWIGPRSDRAYGESLGLPQRYDHQSGVNYFGQDTLTKRDLDLGIQAGEGFLHRFDHYHPLLRDEIRRVANLDWNSKTRGTGNVPDGVLRIRNALNQNQTLQQIIPIATQEATRSSWFRKEYTQNFYNAISTIDVQNKANMKQKLNLLQRMQ